jgi:Na+-translocating ferredoxin:NAD+ oxidoreductase RnfA subunit
VVTEIILPSLNTAVLTTTAGRNVLLHIVQNITVLVEETKPMLHKWLGYEAALLPKLFT